MRKQIEWLKDILEAIIIDIPNLKIELSKIIKELK